MRYVSCQGFAGGFACGTSQAGFELVHLVEQRGGFGTPNCEANRHILGEGWKAQACDPADWEPYDCELLIGNPPCSGFSLLSRKDFRGEESTINECMWAFAEYAARCRPQVAIFESVGQAYSGGIGLMRRLHEDLQQRTQEGWWLHHVLHNNASVGGASIRRRYFWLVSRVPFGIERPEVKRVPTLLDVIGDLQDLGSTWEAQPYRRPPSWWAGPLRSQDGIVDGMHWRLTPATRRALDLIPGAGPWLEKEIVSTVARRHHERHGRLPESWGDEQERKLVERNWQMGFNQLIRWRGDKMARVITGGGLDLVMHPRLDRTLTHREVARIQGFPDDWLIRPLRGNSGLQLTWGKGIPVHAGRWIADWARLALEGTPGSYRGEPVPGSDREYVIDVTEAFRTATSER